MRFVVARWKSCSHMVVRLSHCSLINTSIMCMYLPGIIVYNTMHITPNEETEHVGMIVNALYARMSELARVG